MLSITDRQGADQNHKELSLHVERLLSERPGLGVSEDVEKRNGWWERELVPPLWKPVRGCLRELPHDPAVSLLHIYPKRRKALT